MPYSTAVPGWERFSPGELEYMGFSRTSKKYLSPQGQIVSYRTYLDAAAKQSGFSSYRDYSSHADAVSYFRQHNPNKLDLSVGSEGLAQLYQVIIKEKGKNIVPHGELARFLEDLGLRERDANYEVGDSPKGGE